MSWVYASGKPITGATHFRGTHTYSAVYGFRSRNDKPAAPTGLLQQNLKSVQLIVELKSLKNFQTLGPGGLFPSFYSLTASLHVLFFLAQTNLHLTHPLICFFQLNWTRRAKPPCCWKCHVLQGRSGLQGYTVEACAFGTEFQQKGTLTPSMSWHISAPASATIHRVTGPYSKSSLPDPAPTLSASPWTLWGHLMR